MMQIRVGVVIARLFSVAIETELSEVNCIKCPDCSKSIKITLQVPVDSQPSV